MIRVSIDPQELVFRLDGHAGYAPEGQDIVCASASMMAAMLFEYVLQTVSIDDLGECQLVPGHAELDVHASRVEDAAACMTVFEAVRQGFKLLTRRYPEYVIMD